MNFQEPELLEACKISACRYVTAVQRVVAGGAEKFWKEGGYTASIRGWGLVDQKGGGILRTNRGPYYCLTGIFGQMGIRVLLKRDVTCREGDEGGDFWANGY